MNLEQKLLDHLESLKAQGVDINADPALRSLAGQIRARLTLLATISLANYSLAVATAVVRSSPRRLDHEPLVLAGARLRTIRKRVEESRLTDEFCASVAAELADLLNTLKGYSPQGT